MVAEKHWDRTCKNKRNLRHVPLCAPLSELSHVSVSLSSEQLSIAPLPMQNATVRQLLLDLHLRHFFELQYVLLVCVGCELSHRMGDFCEGSVFLALYMPP